MTSLTNQLKRSIVETDHVALAALIPLFLETNRCEEMFNECVYPALDTICRNLQEHKIAIPELLRGLQSVNLIVEKTAGQCPSSMTRHSIVLGVIEGDTHDMGKNIIRDLYRGYGYRVVDLGKGVSPEKFAESALAEKADIVGISTMMSTTLSKVREAVSILKQTLPRVKVITGGAFLNEQIAREMDADGYAESAARLIEATETLFR